MNRFWYVICEFTDEESGPGAGILLFKGKNIEEAIDYLNNLDIDKKLSNYQDKKIKIIEYLDQNQINDSNNRKWLVVSRNSCGGFDIDAEFNTYDMAKWFAYELVNEHPYAKYYLLEDKPL